MLKIYRSVMAASALFAAASAPPVHAQTYQSYYGHINQVFMSGPENFAFRIFLDSGFGDCTDGFAYINADFPNYQAYVSGLLTAYAQRKRTRVVVTKIDHSGVSYCQITEFGFDDN